MNIHDTWRDDVGTPTTNLLRSTSRNKREMFGKGRIDGGSSGRGTRKHKETRSTLRGGVDTGFRWGDPLPLFPISLGEIIPVPNLDRQYVEGRTKELR